MGHSLKGAMSSAAPYWKHMRMTFQLLLAPLFLWGLLLAGGAADAAAIAAFLSLHLFLYPGATAFNSSYDRDTGPVSGIAAPGHVPPHLLRFSIALQLVGALIATFVGAAFLFIYVILAVIFLAYSHPATRLKARPIASGLVVSLGQGALGFAAGWTASTKVLPPIDDVRVALGALIAALSALGLYPSTQIFQVDEDIARGDRTIAVALGPSRALEFGALCLCSAGLIAAFLLATEGAPLDGLLIGAGFAALALRHAMFAQRLRRGSEAHKSFEWATATRVYATFGFIAFLTIELSQPLS